MPVPVTSSHRHIIRGDVSVKKYAQTMKVGNTTIHIIEPQNVTEEQQAKVLADFYRAGWAIVDELIANGRMDKDGNIVKGVKPKRDRPK